MLLDIVKKGSVDRSVVIRIIDSTDGTPETGVVFNTSGIDLKYHREGSTATSITEATLSALNDAHSDGGFLHKGSGYYRLDLPDAAFATGANWVDVYGDVTGMVVIGGRVRLVNYDLEDAVRLGLTALPNAPAEAAGGLYTRGSGAGQINQNANGQVDTRAVAMASAAVQAIWDALTSALTTASSIGKLLVDNVNATISSRATPAQVNTEADTALADAGVTTTRTGYLDNLSAGAVAQASALATLAGKFTGITLLAEWLGLIAGKQTGNATARTELRATGAGSGTYDETTDSQEAQRDNMGTAQTGDSFARIGANGAGLLAVPWNAAWDAEVQSEVQDAIEVNHLDHLLAVTYDPASKPGAADALLNELVESDAGVSRYTANALEQAPTGGSAPTAAAIADAVWDETLADHLGAGSTGAGLNAAGSAGDPWATALPGAYGAGSAGKIIGDNLNATVGSRATQASVDDLPTNAELATALAAADDAVLAAIAALNNLSQANIRTAIGMGSANLDTQLDALPTNAELATALAAADDAVLAAIAALNNLSMANVRTAIGLGSANLDTQLDALPTNAELATALASADDAVLAAIAALNNLSAAQVTAAVPTAVQNADALLKRDFSAVSGEATRSALNALRFLRNKWTLNGLGALSVKKEDDTTEAWAGTATRAAGDPVTEINPA